MAHSHDHPHRPRAWRPLLAVFVVTAGYCVVEAVAGWWTHSLALLADAGHMLTDVLAVGLSLGAAWLGTRPADARHTYGYHRVEILIALLNGVLLWGLVVWIGWEAFHRLAHPPLVLGAPMLGVAVVGLFVNLLSARILSQAAQENLNVRGAYLHVLFDALGSVGAIVAGLLIVWKGWLVADPLTSVATACLIVWSAWTVIQEAVRVLMEGAPAHVDLGALRDALLRVEGVADVHDLHVWTLTSGMEAMSGHALIYDVSQSQEILHRAQDVLVDRFCIRHMTLQLETKDLEPCEHPYHP